MAKESVASKSPNPHVAAGRKPSGCTIPDGSRRSARTGTSLREASDSGAVRVAVIGCGAVAQQFHLPVLAGHEGVQLVALVDRDEATARQLAEAYDVPAVYCDVEALNANEVDAALIATPPFHHAPCAIALAAKGIHLFVEKPMALTTDDALEMIRATDEANVVLSIGHFRRLFPSTRMLRSVLDSGMLGRPVGFQVEAGSVYAGPLASLGNLRRAESGGGVLMDIGPHVLDQLLYVFDARGEVISYHDNGLGGIETDCALQLRLWSSGESIEGHVALSRTRKLRGTVRIDCERGSLEVRTTEPAKIDIRPLDVTLVDPMGASPRDFDMTLGWKGEPIRAGYEPFRAEIDDWLNAIRTGSEPCLSGRSALPTVTLIETCYQQVQPLNESWVEEGLERTKSGVSATPRTASSEHHPPRRVLVTGANGFVGCRVAERLLLGEGCEVRALVHNPGHAARLARLPVDMVSGDITSAEDIARALEGCDAVVHCAIGTAYGDARKIESVTVDGTDLLADAARRAGVRRFVHISTTAVHGTEVTGCVSERTPVEPTPGDAYSQSKALAERVVSQQVLGGLSAVTLRLANVYGPYCPNLIERPVSFLIRDALRIVGDVGRSSNTIYVDNVAEAIVCALAAPEERVTGEVFTLGQEDDYSWDEFFGYFANVMGGTLQSISLEEHLNNRRGAGTGPIAWSRNWTDAAVGLIRSSEFKSLGRKMLDTPPIGTGPRRLLERFPVIRRSVEKVLSAGGPAVYTRSDSATSSSVAGMTMNPIHASVGIAKAKRLLGYTPVVDRARAMELTAQWLTAGAPSPDVTEPASKTVARSH